MGWGISPTPRLPLPPGKTRYPLYGRLGGPQDRSGQVRKISPPQGFDPRTVQPVVIRYTNYESYNINQQNAPLLNEVRVYYINKLYQTCTYNRLPEDEPSGSKHVEDIVKINILF